MNLEQARFNMIEQQIRPWDVLDQSVLSLLAAVRRDLVMLPPDQCPATNALSRWRRDGEREGRGFVERGPELSDAASVGFPERPRAHDPCLLACIVGDVAPTTPSGNDHRR